MKLIKSLMPELEAISQRKIPGICNRVIHIVARKTLSFVVTSICEEA